MTSKNKEKLHVMYVFTENNKVYVKKNRFSFSSNNIAAKHEEWLPINFQWEAS